MLDNITGDIEGIEEKITLRVVEDEGGLEDTANENFSCEGEEYCMLILW